MKILKKECEICGEKNKKVLDAHHVIPVSDPKSTNLASNLICVCSNCHRKIHAKEVVIEGRLMTTSGAKWFWHKKGGDYTIKPGVILNDDGTATIVEE